MVLTLAGLLALVTYPFVVLADAFGHDHPDPATLMLRVARAERGMTDDGVPWVAGR